MIEFGRRIFLGGAAALIGLPWLESLAPRIARAETGPKARRLIVFYVPNGIPRADWIPSSTELLDLPPALSPLAPLADRAVVVSGLANAVAEGELGPHTRGTGSFLTAVRVAQAEDRVQNGVSVDQLAVQMLAPETRLRSLQLGLDTGSNVGSCGDDFSCAYSTAISWSDATTPIPKITYPWVIFDHMFAGIDPSATAAEIGRRRRLEKSLLDGVLEDTKVLERRIANRDRQKIDELLTGIREVERRIETSGAVGACVPPSEDELSNASVQEHSRTMNQLIALAVQCDLTRFVTHMLADSGSDRSFEFIGVSKRHHDASHHDGDEEKLAAMRAIATWEVGEFVDLVDRLARIEEEGGTALDHSILLFSSELGDGNAHDHVDLPTIVAGGAFRGGRHLALEREPIANLFISVLGALGARVDSFGQDGTRPLPEL